MAAFGWALIAIGIILIAGAGGYILYSYWRARRLGLPPPNFNPFSRNRGATGDYRPPAPAPKGVVGWFKDQFGKLRSGRTTAGAYESTGYGGGSGGRRLNDRRGFGPLDPDEAWDARVDNEAGGYYEEQELGLQDPSHGPYGGGGYGVGVGGIEEGRGRSRSRQRELDDRYDAEMHGGAQRLNPFGDQAEASSMQSLRSVSPRPDMPTSQPSRSGHTRGQSSLGTTHSDDSPTERKSMFREDV